MEKNYKKAISTFIRNFYGENHCLTFGFFNQNLSLRISSSSPNGSGRSNMGNGVTATVNFEAACYLYQVAMSIVNEIGPEKEKRALIERGDTTIILEYVRDQHNQLVASLTISKNNQSFSYKFAYRTYQVKEDGQVITKVMQSELGAFAKTIEGYLIGTGADRHLAKMPDGYENSQDENQQSFNAAGNNSQW